MLTDTLINKNTNIIISIIIGTKIQNIFYENTEARKPQITHL